MAGTIADTALQIIAATASDAGLQLAVNWLNQRYAEFCARARTNQNRRYGSIYAPSPITLPTVIATTGSTAITFSAAPVDPVSAAQVSVKGYQIRVGVNWYWITAHVLGSTSATLGTPFSEVGGAGLGCTILKRYLPVTDASARWVSQMVHQRRRKKLRNKPFAFLQDMYAARTIVGAFPWCWTEAPRTVDGLDLSPILGTQGQKFVEVYPYSSQQETYGYVYWDIPQTFLVTDSLPPEMDEYILREGVLIDVYRYKSEQWAGKGNSEMAGFYANKEARQMTIWEKKIQEGMVIDALYHPQVPVEIDMFEDSGEFSGDIINAHEWIMSEWSQ